MRFSTPSLRESVMKESKLGRMSADDNKVVVNDDNNGLVSDEDPYKNEKMAVE